MTKILFLLDESGSMAETASDVRGGFNSYVEKLKQDGEDYSLSVIKFGTTVRPLFFDIPLQEAPFLSTENYVPWDSTALYDALGYAMSTAKEHWRTPEHPYGQEKVLCITMTDGFENASKNYTKEGIVAKMKRREQAGNWTFIYMGADQDAWGASQPLGFASGNVISYNSNTTSRVFTNLAATTSANAGYTQTTNFFTDN